MKMDEELLKRNTDCVYFLASPFTCKKGVECEYRHSDMARLNPRDCWFWLSGNCLNPTCPFRHSPLEIHNEGSTEAAASVHKQTSVTVAAKTTVPCYYYYSGFCNKGDKCPFLHEPSETSVMNPKGSNADADAPMPPSNTKTSAKRNTGATPKEKHPSGHGPSEMVTIRGSGLEVQQKQLTQLSANKSDLGLKSPVQSYVPEYVQPAAYKTMTLEPVEDTTEGGCEPSSGCDQSSEELMDGNVLRDEWLESSPGFDVLVDGQTEDGGYQDDLEYMHPHNGTVGEQGHLFMQHDFADRAEYDEGGPFNNALYELSEYAADELRTDGRFSRRQERNARHTLAVKQKYCSVESTIGGCNNEDLRDYLRSRRMTDQYLQTHDLRHDLVHRRESQERTRSHAFSQRLQGRLASRVERNGLRLDRRTSVAGPEQQGKLRKSQHNAYREHNGTRRHHHSAEGQPRSHFKRQKYSMDTTTFTGPKSLYVVKEHRRHGHQSKNGSVDFDGPKPLSEILKEKRKTTSSGDGTMADCF